MTYSINDLTQINEELQPLKALADREFASIYGLSGQVYTPHIDAHDQVCLKKAEILLQLKTNGLMPFTDVEIITAKLMALYQKAHNHQIVEHDGYNYECKYSPLKLSKSGKSVRRWAKYWLRKLPNDEIDRQWQSQVHEIWPEKFLIRNIHL
ncbi:MAG: hypothetical protein ACSHW0_13025 [Thalassotalea sp.]